MKASPRVEVLETRPAEPGEHFRYRSAARVRTLESFRGPAAGELVTLRFDNGAPCENVRYSAGERDLLLFAEPDTDGAFSTVNYGNGKKGLGPGSAGLLEEVRRLCGRLDHRVTLRATPAADRHLPAEELRLEVSVANRGKDHFLMEGKLRTEVRERRRERLKLLEAGQRLSVKVILEEQEGEPLRALAEKRTGLEESSRAIALGPGEIARSSLPLSKIMPGASGKVRLKAWALFGGRMAGPIELAVDFGEREGRREELLEMRKARESAVPLGLLVALFSFAVLSVRRGGRGPGGGRG